MWCWFFSGSRQWWIDRDPPPDGLTFQAAAIEEVDCIDLQHAMGLVWQIFGIGSDGQIVGLLSEVEPGAAFHRMRPGELHQALAVMITRRRIRIWHREFLPEMTLDSGPARPSGAPSPAPASGRPRPPPPPPAAPPRPAAPAAAPGGQSPRPGAAPAQPLHWYQFTVVDESGDGLKAVLVDLTTPAGTQRLKTNDAGTVRINNVPAGEGSAVIDRDSLEAVLHHRVDRPRRKGRPPAENADFKVVTPLRASRVFRFPHERPHRVMVISRTDVLIAGADPRWQSLAAEDSVRAWCSFDRLDLDRVGLCSRGSGEAARVDSIVPVAALEPPDPSPFIARASAAKAVYVVKPGDSLFAIAGRLLGDFQRWPEIRDANQALLASRPPNLIHPGDRLQIPVPAALGLIPLPGDWPAGAPTDRSPFLDLDIDGLHEALFDTRGEPGFEQLASALRQPAPPPEPDFGTPQPAADAAAVLAGVVAVEQGLPVDALFAPLFLQEFDPVERAGPPRRPARPSRP